MQWSDDFDGERLDTRAWLPHYLPAWSSRADTAAAYTIAHSRLTLRIPRQQGLWCPDEHESPLRVSGIMSGHHSGPVGSTASQQPIFDGQLVREEQPAFRGRLLRPGTVEVRCAMTISPRSMAALWLVGWEEVPEHSGEICVVEIFGRSVDGEEVRRCAGPPTYDLQLMVAVFDVPDWSDGNDHDLEPELAVDWVRTS